MKFLVKVLKVVLVLFFSSFVFFLIFSYRPNPENIKYGVSFSKYRAEELGLDYKTAFISIMDDLGVRKLRLSAHWPMVEPEKDRYSFEALDFQISEAKKRNATIILGVGRRLPSWPECHIPDWARDLSWEEQKKEILEIIERVVLRYKDEPHILYWQVENEPFLSVFAKDHCGDLDKIFLEEEIALVKKLDPNRKVLVTDSGNLGLWSGAWKRGDVFGTSVYMYLWNPELGQIRSIYLPSFYKAKTNLMKVILGDKRSLLIELSLEPWLIEPITQAPLDVQLQRMSPEKFDEIIEFAEKTGFDEQYLWGVEWWYWMKQKGNDEFWQKGREIFSR